MIGIDQQLKSLQHPVVCQRVRGLLKVARQLVWLDAAEDGQTEIRDKD